MKGHCEMRGTQSQLIFDAATASFSHEEQEHPFVRNLAPRADTRCTCRKAAALDVAVSPDPSPDRLTC
jgi:hypothetical protein